MVNKAEVRRDSFCESLRVCTLNKNNNKNENWWERKQLVSQLPPTLARNQKSVSRPVSVTLNMFSVTVHNNVHASPKSKDVMKSKEDTLSPPFLQKTFFSQRASTLNSL